MRFIYLSLIVFFLTNALEAQTKSAPKKPAATKATKPKATPAKQISAKPKPLPKIEFIDEKGLRDHLKEHIEYPATRAQILASCDNMGDLPEADKKAVTANLPEGTYKSELEVFKALRL